VFQSQKSLILTYRERLCVCKIKRLSPEILILRGHARLIVISRLIPMLHFQASVNGHCIDDVHLVRGNKLVLSVVVFPSAAQIFRSVQPAQSDVNMFWVQRAHFQDFRLPLRGRVDCWVFRVVVFDQDTLACRNTLTSNYSPLSATFFHCAHPIVWSSLPVNFLYRRRLSHLSLGSTLYCTVNLS